MRNVYLFNPENDLAVAHGRKRYDAPKAARRLAADLSLLPLWYAEKSANSLILTPSLVPVEFNRGLFSELGMRAEWILEKDYESHSEDVFHPWGWSLPLVDRLEHLTKCGVGSPDLVRYRAFSGRQFALSILHDLKQMNAIHASVKVPTLCASLAESQQAVADFGSRCLMKSPWSGSGRGLLWVREGWSDSVAAWCNNILKRQGEVVCEPQYDKVQDFAMEFCVKDSQLAFVGYSYFETDDSGVYRGNLLASDAYIEQRLAAWLPVSELHRARHSLMAVLSERLAPYYEGYFGVDMMVCQSLGEPFLHPCVELNLRFNMGLVAHKLFENYIQPQAVGRYAILHGRDASELRRFVSEMSAKHPLLIENGKVAAGFLPLTYIADDSEFLAYSLVE